MSALFIASHEYDRVILRRNNLLIGIIFLASEMETFLD